VRGKIHAARLTAMAACVLLAAPLGVVAADPGSSADHGRGKGPIVSSPMGRAISTPLELAPYLPPTAGPKFMSKRFSRLSPPRIPRGPAKPDPVVQSSVAPSVAISQPLGFPGIGSDEQTPMIGEPLTPPDTNGAVGPNHYVQIVNLTFSVYAKNGTRLAGPTLNNALWAALAPGSPCREDNDGDPIVLYDRLADRWIISQLALPNFPAGPFFQCIAVSVGSDPAGAYYLYEYQVSADKLNDYPKLGVWPDGYYMSANQFGNCRFDGLTITCDWAGPVAIVFERAQMLVGDPNARMIKFEVPSANMGGLLPSHLSGFDPRNQIATVPPAGTPNAFIQVDDGAWFNPAVADRLQIWPFHVDWGTPANSTFGVNPPGSDTSLILPVATFDSNLCNNQPCIAQPVHPFFGMAPLDPISDRLLHPLNYRKFPGYETIVTNHTVDVGADRAGIRWYELRRTSGDWFVSQQGTYAPADSENRWMGSIAMDGAGNIALGYSVSSLSTFPSIRYASRRPCDPAGQLGAEVRIVDGGGTQLDSGGRWGDYSAMAVDPTDDRTFWYTQEYYATYDFFWGRNWVTRITPFTVASCTLPSISIADASVSEGNSGTVQAVFTVTLSEATDQPVTVRYATADGTATTANADYQAQSGTLTFAARVTSRTITIVVNSDTVVEPNEAFFVNLDTPTNATIARGRGVGTIVNDDTAPPSGSIRVLRPNGGETLRVGRRTGIQWTSSTVTGPVDVRLSLDGGVTYPILLFNDTPNDGTQQWRPANQTTQQGRIQICSSTAPTVCDASNGNFRIRP
jgi:hypothetical protein